MASRDAERGGFMSAAGRIAFYPARVAARASKERLEASAEDILAGPELGHIVDRALAGPLPEQLARSLAEQRVLERVVAELAASGELDRLVVAALSSPHTQELADRVLESPEARRALERIVSGPEVRGAIARETTGLAEEMIGGLRRRTAVLDGSAESFVNRRPAVARTPYAGVATRAVALAVDAFTTTVIAASLSAMLALIASLVGTLRPAWLVGLLLASGWALLVGAYFTLFWSLAGQTPGMRLLRLRVRGPEERPLGFWRAALRLVGLALAIIPLFAGFVPVLFDKRRRGLHDVIAGTTVTYDS